MPKRDSLQGSLDLMVLKILSRRPKLHGYAIMTAIKDTRGCVVRRGGIALPGAARDGEAGWKQLAAEESRSEAVTSAVNRVLRMA